MNQAVEFVELRSEDVQEVLTRVPSWLLRWGVTVMFIILVMLSAGAWIAHYPDLVRASCKLTSVNTPKGVVTHADGKLVRLLISEGDLVQSGATLAYIESTARHDEVLCLLHELNSAGMHVKINDAEHLSQLVGTAYHHLGELQTAFQTFEQARIQLKAYLSNGYYNKKRALLMQELIDLHTLATNLARQHALQARDVKLAQEDYDIQRQLARDKVIAPLELKREESKTIARELPFEQTTSAIINNMTAQRSKQKEILELDKQVTEQRDNFGQAFNTLLSATQAWKAKYIVTAPIAGRVYFPTILQENQYINANMELFFISSLSTDYIGELRIPQNNFGKVKVGQTVLIKFVGYPYQEFGAVQGRIQSIAEIAIRDSLFLAKVVLPHGLKTAYGKMLTYRTGMLADADIITDDSRLLVKLFYQLRKSANGR